MNRNRKIFVIAFFVFLAIVIVFFINMWNQTTPPWNKRKETLDKYKVQKKKYYKQEIEIRRDTNSYK